MKGSGRRSPLVTATIWLMELVVMCPEANCVRQVPHNRNRRCGVSSLGTFASGITVLELWSEWVWTGRSCHCAVLS